LISEEDNFNLSFGAFLDTVLLGNSYSLLAFFLSVLVQIDLMISGNQPVKAMTYIADLTLFWVVFNLHPKVEPTVSEECQGYDKI
jgi:hypothetical protein